MQGKTITMRRTSLAAFQHSADYNGVPLSFAGRISIIINDNPGLW
jgi:hypothetical protein